MLQRALLTDNDVQPLAEGVMTVLEEIGVLCQNAAMLRAMASMGARVDTQAQHVWFPRALTAQFIEALRAEGQRRLAFSLYGAEGGDGGKARAEQPTETTARFIAPPMPAIGTQVAQFYYDHATGQTRSSNRADLITATKFGDALHRDQGVGHALAVTDVPPLMEPLESAMLLAEYAHSPGSAFAWNVRQVDYLLEMGEILGLGDWFSWGAICFAHPLRMDRDVADRFERQVKAGAPTGLTAMPVAGVSTPMTVEGFIVVSSAEHVATWMAARALNPDVPLSGSIWPGSLDMRTGHVSYCAFDGMYYGFAASEFLRRWTGLQVPVGGGEYCDAKAPGMYAALEKAYKAMMIAAFSGEHPDVGQGMLDEGKVLAPVQLILEHDYAAGVAQFARKVSPTQESIAMPTIREVGVGLQSNYLQSDHTARLFRSCTWMPQFVDKSGWAGAASDEQALAKAQAKVEALLASYEKPQGREDQLAAMRTVIERARRELLG